MRKLGIHGKRGFTLVELLASMALLALITLMVFVIFSQSTGAWKKSGARIDTHIAARAILDQMAREIRGAVMVENFAGPASGSTMGRMDFVVLHAGDPGDPVNTEHNLLEWRTPSLGDTREQPCSDQVYFIAPVQTGIQARQDYCVIGYWVQDPNNDTSGTYEENPRRYERIDGHSDDVLRRFFVTDNSSNPDWENMDFTQPKGLGSVNDEFALNVKSLRIRCWSDFPNAADFTTMWEDEANSPASAPDIESKVNWNTQDAPGTFDHNRLPKAVKITIVVQDEKEIEKEREFSTVVYLDNAKR
jgi:prepilin-type N-terminal cleavage/methylation domain-containing protein